MRLLMIDRVVDLHTIDVKEWQECNHFVGFMAHRRTLRRLDHERIRHDILMRQHHPLRQARCSTGVHQKRNILLRIDFLRPMAFASPKQRRRHWLHHILEMRNPPLVVLLVINQQNALQRKAYFLRRLQHGIQTALLRHDALGATVFQQIGELGNRRGRVHGRDDAAHAQDAPYHGRDVYAIGRHNCKNVAFLPVPSRFESCAE